MYVHFATCCRSLEPCPPPTRRHPSTTNLASNTLPFDPGGALAFSALESLEHTGKSLFAELKKRFRKGKI